MRLRTDGLSWREIDGETVILDLESSTYFRANRTGTVLLHALTEECNRADLVDRLASDFDLSPDQAATDVDTFLRALSDRGFLTGAGA
jgi:Coenzyme PQQ synthesis protein D (PqqD)